MKRRRMSPNLRNAIQSRLWVHRALERTVGIDPSLAALVRRAEAAVSKLTAAEFAEYFQWARPFLPKRAGGSS